MTNLLPIALHFLVAIQAVETNNGKIMGHRTLTSGLHAGDAARGRWGVMPNTAKMLRCRDPESFQCAYKYALKVLRASRGDMMRAQTLWLYGAASRQKTDTRSKRATRFKLEWAKFK